MRALRRLPQRLARLLVRVRDGGAQNGESPDHAALGGEREPRQQRSDLQLAEHGQLGADSPDKHRTLKPRHDLLYTYVPDRWQTEPVAPRGRTRLDFLVAANDVTLRGLPAPSVLLA